MKKIILILFFLPLTANSKVLYLIQNVFDPDQILLLTEKNKANLLFINRDCASCLKRIPALLQEASKKKAKFYVFLNGKSWGKVKALCLLEKISKKIGKHIYNDPGRRLSKKLNLNDPGIKSSFVRYEKGKFLLNTKIDITSNLQSPFDMEVWKVD